MSLTSGLSGGLVAKLNAIGSMRGAGGATPLPPDPPGTADLRLFIAGDVAPGLYPEQLGGSDLTLLGQPPQESAFQ